MKRKKGWPMPKVSSTLERSVCDRTGVNTMLISNSDEQNRLGGTPWSTTTVSWWSITIMDQTEKTSSFRHGGTGRCQKKLESSWDWHWLLTATAYCICNGPNDGSFMMACDFCDEWFHGNCAGVTEKQGHKTDLYVCPECKRKGFVV